MPSWRCDFGHTPVGKVEPGDASSLLCAPPTRPACHFAARPDGRLSSVSVGRCWGSRKTGDAESSREAPDASRDIRRRCVPLNLRGEPREFRLTVPIGNTSPCRAARANTDVRSRLFVSRCSPAGHHGAPGRANGMTPARAHATHRSHHSRAPPTSLCSSTSDRMIHRAPLQALPVTRSKSPALPSMRSIPS